MNGNFTGLIHNEFNFCTNKNLPMPYDLELVGWLSATETLEELFFWFTKEDIFHLEEFGYKICEYETNDFKQYKNHKVINQKSSKFIRFIDLKDIVMKEEINSAVNIFKEILTEFSGHFEVLGNVAKEASKSISDFEIAFAKAFPKRYQKALRFKRKVEDLTVEYCEMLFEDGTMCSPCWKSPDTCEGSHCGQRMEEYFSDVSRKEMKEKLFECFGDRFYSFSRRVKNELLKPE